MTDPHPITPPLLLVEELQDLGNLDAIQLAYQAGADHELEACCDWLDFYAASSEARDLRAARRPKPPSLKEQALDAWDRLRNEAWCEEIDGDLDFVRRALEALPND